MGGIAKLSIVIPAYNAAGTIGRVLDSVMAQNAGGVTEVIIVNDGSTDATLSVVEAYREPLNLRIIDLKCNGGLARASATGIDAASGRYITRLDADDELPPGALNAYLGAMDGDPDIIWGAMARVERSGIMTVVWPPESVKLNDLAIDVVNFSMCSKAVKSLLLKRPEMRAFPGLDLWEDLGVVVRLLAVKPVVTRVPDVVYNYIIAPPGQSLSTSAREKLLEHHIKIATLLEQWFNDHHLEDENREFIEHLKFAAKVKMLRGRGRNVVGWKTVFPEVNNRVMKLRHVSLYHRLLFATVAILPSRVAQWISDAADRLTAD